MTHTIGQLTHAMVGERRESLFPAIVYLSLTCEGKGNRRDHCWRYAPPSNMEVPRDWIVEPGEPLGRESDIEATQYMKP